MKKRDFEKKLKEKWFNSLKEGDEILVKDNNRQEIHKIVNKDYAFKTIMILNEKEQMYWIPLSKIFPVPEHMNTELYRALMEIEIEEE